MSVYEHITENMFLFGSFWVFTCVLGLLTAVIFRRSAYKTWVKIIGIPGDFAAIHFAVLMLVIGLAAMPTLNTMVFNIFISTALWLLVFGIAIYKLRPVKEVKG